MDNRIVSVQYLRAVAALLVVVAHAGAHPLAEGFFLYDRLGQFGVTLFFVISGFIMVAITGKARVAPLDFLRRRIVRVVPLYWLFTGLAALLAVLAPSLFKSTVFTWPHFLQSLAFIPHVAPGRGGTSPLLSLGWTLNYEAFFYVGFALLAVLLAWQRVAVLAGAFVALVIIGLVAAPADPVLAFYTDVALLPFASGAVIGMLWLEGRFAGWPRSRLAGLAILALLAGLVTFVLDRSSASLPSFLALLVLCSALVAGGLALERHLPRLGWLELLGDASYAIYLVHMFVVGALVALAGRVADPSFWPVGLAIIATALVAATLAGVLVHKFVEQPLLRLLRGRRPAKAKEGLAPTRLTA